jgi:hypothetical protein
MTTHSVPARVLSRLRRQRSTDLASAEEQRRLAARVAALEAAVEENRRLNQRLADVVDVVTEVLVPAVDRDDERLRRALADLDKVLDEPAAGSG